SSSLVERRARELGMHFIRQGTWDKVKDFEELLAEAGLSAHAVAYVGDDVTDIPLMQLSELSVAVADATEETRAAAHYVTRAPGGFGAVREVTDLILKAQGRWSELMRKYII
ncbi:MAG TPA: HAD hydrolase family protein, partial [Pyrinomonadaceae bacterium]|nr:HAD hydrolase family protein [Pyrinomonadaceae bacterium]